MASSDLSPISQSEASNMDQPQIPYAEAADPSKDRRETEIRSEEASLPDSASDASIEESGGREEDEGECGFCLFMKRGGCRDTFIEWEKCVEEGERNEEDIAEKCFQVTSALKKCMEVHSDYYAPLLEAEKAAEEAAAKQLEESEGRRDGEGIKDDSGETLT